MQSDVSRSEVSTPALILDLDILESNILAMAERARSLGVGLRPHFKSHKCLEIARRLARAGALGASCATVAEAEALAAGGITGILLTSTVSTPDAWARIRRLLSRGTDLKLVVDHPDQVGPLGDLAIQLERRLSVLIDLDVGHGRTGCLEDSDALALARHIAECSVLHFAGLQAYWGHLQHTKPFEERRRGVQTQASRISQLVATLSDHGLQPEIVTGGGTGTHWIDGQAGIFTELQPGSFLFMDSGYSAIEMSPEGNPFQSSLFVAGAVISANRADRVIINTGFKAMATDFGTPLPQRGAPANATYRFYGDEHGAIEFQGGPRPALGSVIEVLPSRSDTTVNLFSRYHVVRGNSVVDEWEIAARGY